MLGPLHGTQPLELGGVDLGRVGEEAGDGGELGGGVAREDPARGLRQRAVDLHRPPPRQRGHLDEDAAAVVGGAEGAGGGALLAGGGGAACPGGGGGGSGGAGGR